MQKQKFFTYKLVLYSLVTVSYLSNTLAGAGEPRYNPQANLEKVVDLLQSSRSADEYFALIAPFWSEQDKSYLRQYWSPKLASKIKVSQMKASFESEGVSVVIEPDKQSASKFKINGRSWELKAGQSAEGAVKSLAKIIEGGPSQAQALNLWIWSEAQAQIKAGVIVGLAFLGLAGLFSLACVVNKANADQSEWWLNRAAKTASNGVDAISKAENWRACRDFSKHAMDHVTGRGDLLPGSP